MADTEAPVAEVKRGPGRPRKDGTTKPPPKVGLKLKGMHRASGSDLDHGIADIKLLRPICHICAPEVEKAGHGWWDRCPHDPYVGERGEPREDLDYADELDADGNVIGRVLTKTNKRQVLRPWPNLVGVAQSRRLNSGRGVEYKTVLYGYIYPQDLVSPAFPNGISRVCDFRECFWQDDLKEYTIQGREFMFCQELEAILVYESEVGTVPEVNNPEIRKDQQAISKTKLLAKRS
jgi:hypothetical protein